MYIFKESRALVFSGKDGKKNYFTALPGLDCLANTNGINTAPSGVFLYPLRSSLAKSTEREGLVSANNISVL